jgi:plasmid maintenance system antidote protein VapI
MSNELTVEEQTRVRTALRYLRARCGGRSWEPLAKALHLKADSLAKVAAGRRGVSAALTFRVARLAKVGVDEILTAGKFPPPGTCPRCGHCDTAPAV